MSHFNEHTQEMAVMELFEQQEKLLRQIESLEKQCRTERQTRKKYELHQKLQELKLKIKQA